MISVENFITFIEKFCEEHDCAAQTMRESDVPIDKVTLTKYGRKHTFEMPLRPDMSMDDLVSIFYDEWKNSGFDNITTVTKEPNSPDKED